jgi:hypothetical protein
VPSTVAGEASPAISNTASSLRTRAPRAKKRSVFSPPVAVIDHTAALPTAGDPALLLSSVKPLGPVMEARPGALTPTAISRSPAVAAADSVTVAAPALASTRTFSWTRESVEADRAATAPEDTAPDPASTTIAVSLVHRRRRLARRLAFLEWTLRNGCPSRGVADQGATSGHPALATAS